MPRLIRRVVRRRKRALGGISSQPPGSYVSKLALGGDRDLFGNRSLATTTHGPAMAGTPDWYRSMNGSSLGDDPAATLTGSSLSQPTIVEPGSQMSDWQRQMLNATRSMIDKQQVYMAKETQQRWWQLIATLAIPLSAAIWGIIFKGGRQSSML